MSETTLNRKERRARSRPPVPARRLASLMQRVSTVLNQGERESEPDYFLRIRRMALRVQHEQRRAKRKSARDARKRNR